jgi:isopentenyl-diphosphate Delta-isomerase
MYPPNVIPAIHPDGSLYPVDKLVAHEEALFHKAISVFAFSDREMLIQRRAKGKYHCGGIWANTCCTHPHWNEKLDDCANRRLREELGFTMAMSCRGEIEYSADVGNGLHEHERVTIYCGQIDRELLELVPDPAEVMDVRWISLEALRAEICADPHLFAPWFLIYMETHTDLIFGR